MKKFFSVFLTVFTVAVLTACGSGGGKDVTPPSLDAKFTVVFTPSSHGYDAKIVLNSNIGTNANVLYCTSPHLLIWDSGVGDYRERPDGLTFSGPKSLTVGDNIMDEFEVKDKFTLLSDKCSATTVK